MEIMEDGNLVDRVRILLQRDMQYYQAMQTVLRESLCARVSGGKLDFPRHASFAAIKIVIWWEAEFREAFRRPSGLSAFSSEDESLVGVEGAIKKTPPSEFILLIIDTSKQFLEHLHTLIQESLDHADLAVLTATLGAAALIRNCLWCYSQQSKDEIPAQSSSKLSECYKMYDEMTEAVAERLLDLHCRLISLYILNEADSLSWQKNKPFFEKERCSFTIQMWWLYMQGTKVDLWNTVSPKMAQRIFSGMLNESLSIIVTRLIHVRQFLGLISHLDAIIPTLDHFDPSAADALYLSNGGDRIFQGRPSLARSEQFWADAFNVLSCSAYLALSACVNADELIGIRSKRMSIAIRDIHAKCRELLLCLLLRGTPLGLLYQVCRKGLESMAILQECHGFSPWLLVTAPSLLSNALPFGDYGSTTLSPRVRVILELNVLRSQPQPNWTQLLKVLIMNDRTVARMLLGNLVRKCVGYVDIQDSKTLKESAKKSDESASCGGFLCAGAGCNGPVNDVRVRASHCLHSITYISVSTFMDPSNVVIPALKEDPDWHNYLDRQQVWNQARPPWLHALLAALRPTIVPIVETLLDAVKTGASLYQAMSLALACMKELFVCAPLGTLAVSLAMNDNLPANCHPLGGSVLLQMFCASLYTALLDVSVRLEKISERSNKRAAMSPRSPEESGTESSSFDPQDRFASATALAEAICSIDEDNKHTDQIDDLLNLIQDWIKSKEPHERARDIEGMPLYIETHTDSLLFTDIGRRSLKISYEYLIRASDCVLKSLKRNEKKVEMDFNDTTDVFVGSKSLTYVMFHIEDIAFDQFLINFDEAHWQAILKTPLSATLERVRSQILLRPEFKNLNELSLDQKAVATSMKLLCSMARSSRSQ